MRFPRGIVLVTMLAGMAASPARGQTAEDAVTQTVKALFDAMRAKDTTALRAVFAPEAHLLRGAVVNGAPTLGVTTVDEFVAAIGGAPAQVLDERIWDVEVRVDANLATVWAKYEFLADGQFSHCGIDAFQLIRLGDDWKVVSVADTARRTNCWHQPGTP